MPDALVSELARALNLPPDAARHTLDHLVATLREQLDATGQARVPGLGTFHHEEDGLSFRPDDALARAVNHRYAGLRPIEAGSRSEEAEHEPEPDDPFADVAPSASSEVTAGFQPLDAYVETEETSEPEPEFEPGETVEFEQAEAPEEISTVSELPDEDVIDDEAFDEATPDEAVFDDEWLDEAEPDVIEEPEATEPEAIDSESTETTGEYGDEWAPSPEPADEDVTLDSVTPQDLDEAAEFDREPEYLAEEDEEFVEADFIAVEDEFTAAEDESSEDEAVGVPDLKGTEDESEAISDTEYEFEPEAAEVLPAAEDDANTLGSLSDLAVPEQDEEEDEEDDEAEATAILSVMNPASSDTEEIDEVEDDTAATPAQTSPPERPPVAPAVAATSRDPVSKPKPAPRRGVPVVPILIGLAAVLGIVALLWFLSREPETPPVAEQPPPADTTETVAAAPAADTASTEAPDAEPPPEPAEPAASADPLRSSASIDPEAGGFSWVVGSELSREPAERRVAEFRDQGLRAGVIAEEAAGRTRYRVALGQFESIEQAERFRSDLPAGVPDDTWLLRL